MKRFQRIGKTCSNGVGSQRGKVRITTSRRGEFKHEKVAILDLISEDRNLAYATELKSKCTPERKSYMCTV